MAWGGAICLLAGTLSVSDSTIRNNAAEGGKGAHGFEGTRGLDGDKGTEGAEGKVGAKGATGAKGADGSFGVTADGLTCTFARAGTVAASSMRRAQTSLFMKPLAAGVHVVGGKEAGGLTIVGRDGRRQHIPRHRARLSRLFSVSNPGDSFCEPSRASAAV